MDNNLELSDEFIYDSLAKTARYNFTLLFSTIGGFFAIVKLSETPFPTTITTATSGVLFFFAIVLTFLWHLKIIERISEKSQLKKFDTKIYLVIFWGCYVLGAITAIISLANTIA